MSGWRRPLVSSERDGLGAKREENRRNVNLHNRRCPSWDSRYCYRYLYFIYSVIVGPRKISVGIGPAREIARKKKRQDGTQPACTRYPTYICNIYKVFVLMRRANCITSNEHTNAISTLAAATASPAASYNFSCDTYFRNVSCHVRDHVGIVRCRPTLPNKKKKKRKKERKKKGGLRVRAYVPGPAADRICLPLITRTCEPSTFSHASARATNYISLTRSRGGECGVKR